MTLMGYRRKNGGVGIRNDILVLPTVVCAGDVARAIADRIPGAVAVTHQHGCAQLEPDGALTRRTLVGFGANPNVAGVIVVGLGCETVQAAPVAREIEARGGGLVRYLVIQDIGDTDDAIAAGVKIGTDMYAAISKYEREPFELSELVVSLECGGSDVTSGIASNPAVGIVSDFLVKNGATVMLCETTELIGAEHLLAKRAVNEAVKNKLLHIVSRMEQRVLAMGVSIIGANPTPGNIEGGLTTIEEKSLGCVYKGGTSALTEVIEFAEAPTQKGLVVMDTPGHDVESMTALAAGGSQLCLFTTGRGTPMGCAVMPVIKICANPLTAKKMRGNIDIDISAVMEGRETLGQAAERIISEIIAVANGKKTAAEQKKMFCFGLNRIGPTM